MISTGLNNINLLFAGLFVVFVSAAGTNTKRTNVNEYPSADAAEISYGLSSGVNTDTAFIVKAIKFHQQQIMLADIADKKLTDTSLKRIVSQIRINHQVSLRDLFAVYQSKDSVKLAEGEKKTGDSQIADRTKELSAEEQKLNELGGTDFTKKWRNIMIEEYDHMIPEFEKAVNFSLSQNMKSITATALNKLKENRLELKQWGQKGNAKN